MNIPDPYSESLKQFLGLKIFKFFDADPDLGSGIFFTWIRDPVGKYSDPGSRINILDPQHRLFI
jgi:hypothetical protein